MTKVKILTNGGYCEQKFQDAIGKAFGAKIKGDMAFPEGLVGRRYIIGTECEIVDEASEPNYAPLASGYGICITTADGVVYDGRSV